MFFCDMNDTINEIIKKHQLKWTLNALPRLTNDPKVNVPVEIAEYSLSITEPNGTTEVFTGLSVSECCVKFIERYQMKQWIAEKIPMIADEIIGLHRPAGSQDTFVSGYCVGDATTEQELIEILKKYLL